MNLKDPLGIPYLHELAILKKDLNINIEKEFQLPSIGINNCALESSHSEGKGGGRGYKDLSRWTT